MTSSCWPLRRQNYRSWWIAYIDRVSSKYSLLINADKAKVKASDGKACRILIQNEQLKQVDMEKSQHSDFNEDTTNERACVICSNVRL